MHFSDADTLTVESRDQDGKRGDKPRGLWLSDESAETNWSSWCDGESYTIGSNAFAVDLAPGANVLYLTDESSLIAFHREFCRDERGWRMDWIAVAERWQGIAITPYQWEFRLSRDMSWYYTWDCASACVWDASAVSSLALVDRVTP
jgi:hypothetical protein